MRPLLLILTLVVVVLSPAQAASLSNVLEQAIRELPARAMADIPLDEREVFLASFRRDIPRHKRLDRRYGYLEFYTDGVEAFHASSMLLMKVFRQRNGNNIVCCFMPKPNADSQPPRNGQFFFFTRRAGRWVDVTAETPPAGVDAYWYFQPRRTLDVIETGPYELTARRDGQGNYYAADHRQFDLVWNGQRFRVRLAPVGAEFNHTDIL